MDHAAGVMFRGIYTHGDTGTQIRADCAGDFPDLDVGHTDNLFVLFFH